MRVWNKFKKNSILILIPADLQCFTFPTWIIFILNNPFFILVTVIVQKYLKLEDSQPFPEATEFIYFFQENAMKLLYIGGWETGHLNDALARVIVEMIKREWPQQWPTLLSELSDACARGHIHTQIVLHIFLRLVEDVATLQVIFWFL